MTQPKKQLDELFESVVKDTPALEKDELRTLLSGKASVRPSIGPLQTSVINEDRKRGLFTKGIFIMTLTAIAITALYLSYSSTISTTEVKTPVVDPNVNHPFAAEGLKKDHTPETVIPSKSHSKVDSKTHSLSEEPEIRPIIPIEINPARMKKLGIVKRESGDVLCFQKLDSKKIVFEMFFRKGVSGISAGIRAQSHCELGENIPYFIPVYITGTNGSKFSASGPNPAQAKICDELSDQEIEQMDKMSAMEIENPNHDIQPSPGDIALIQKISKLISTLPTPLREENVLNANDLIPVLIRKNSIINGKEKQDGLIFWYAPNPEVLATLKGNAAINKNSDLGSVITQVTLFPNPANAKTQIHFALSEKRSIRISLFEITGKKINDASQEMTLEEGEHNSDIQTSLLSSGIYLILLQTDKGEQSIQRLVIEK